MDYIIQITIQLIVSVATIIISVHSARTLVKRDLIRIRSKREDKLQDEFSKMCQAVYSYVESDGSGMFKSTAKLSLSAVRCRYCGKLGNLLDSLQDALENQSDTTIKECLNEAICEYRIVSSKK